MPHLYKEQGYVLYPNFFEKEELTHLHKICEAFHSQWLVNNNQAYTNGALNSNGLTASTYLTTTDQLFLIQFISQPKLEKIVSQLFPEKAIFLNTQLFFDPFDANQKNYWHRDMQYTGLTIEEQQACLTTQNVIHFRIPLKPELGLELIPGTHKAWDTDEVFETRMGKNGRLSSDALNNSVSLKPDVGDLLVFSANMVHRGLYGNDRFAFDIIFCDDSVAFKAFINPMHQPTKALLLQLTNKHLF
ncbi:phytanoyl-CoA dioxygenase family protein [Flavobacterium agricola]|uniref:Phytanoyl-CoA dioxygenase family protein n=1 Tax=Flavobacterium agricola TaxID=2870839 RepID=A0ABY6M0E4_9FLAO|nr:phytanoyl-CoA dioxygenase family protein [Flavobacterium agricola]UYW01906.1 phytanoyl-CoA dioxygenase family protein [Flavobacterium agricola]